MTTIGLLWDVQRRLMRFSVWGEGLYFAGTIPQAALSHFSIMKTSNFNIVLSACVLATAISTNPSYAPMAAPPVPISNINQPALPVATPYAVVSRDANSQVWERTVYELDPSGRAVPKKHRYTELATGLNFRDPTTGQWTPSKEEIDILPDGTAAAAQGQHKVCFPVDIAQGVIELDTPDSLKLQSRPIALSYDDGSNTVLIAVLTNSVGYLVGPNQVIYPNAFDGAAASLRYTYTRAGFEQDILIQEQLPPPELFGLDPATVRLQLLTEYFGADNPAQTSGPINSRDRLKDATLTFGTMKMLQGRAFSVGNVAQAHSPTEGTPTYKSWLHLNGRPFLIEELRYQRIRAQLQALPLSSATIRKAGRGDSVLDKVSATHLLPPMRAVQASTNRIQLAGADFGWKDGVVLDYLEVNSGISNFTFQGDTTYYVSGYVLLNETTSFEGGTVIKFLSSEIPSLVVCGPMVCAASSYRPAVFTTSDDDSVGDLIDGSSGNPAPTAGEIYLADAYGILIYENMRFSYAGFAINAGTPEIYCRDCQFLNCDTVVWFGGDADLHLRNVLVAHCNVVAVDDSCDDNGNLVINAEHLTADDCETLVSTCGGVQPGYTLTNSILTATPLPSAANPSNVVSSAVLGSSVGIYQTVGGGSYYLATNSPYRDAGTTNIDSTLLATLQSKTTYPPIVYSNATISVATTFSPQVQRDTNAAPALGYHYDPLDYVFGGVTAHSNLTFTAGTAVGWFQLPGTDGGAGYGISLLNNVNATFNGTVTSPCTFARYATVQEGGNGLWKDKGWLAGLEDGGNYDPNNPAGVTASFTRFVRLAGDPNHIRDGTSGQPIVIHAKHCEFYGAFGGYNILGAYTNCLFYRGATGIGTGSRYPYQIMVNCSFYGGWLNFGHSEGGAPYWYSYVHNCAFDNTAFNIDDPFGTNTTYADYNYNAFKQGAAQLPTEGPNTVIVTNGYNWQNSWLGNFYLPPDSPLIDAGDRTSDRIGLYHFTTQTNQTIEGISAVDIGYHYVAVTNGVPLDSDSDGLADYLGDSDGNGLPDWYETSYFGHMGVDPNADADGDGWTNLQEFLNGTNPTVVDEPLSVFITMPGAGTVVP